MAAFMPTGPIKSFTAATTAPTSVQASSLNNERDAQYLITNTDSSNDCVIGWGQSDTEAKLNAAAGTSVSKCYYLMRSTQVTISAAPDSYFSGITASSTAVIKVQPGYGE